MNKRFLMTLAIGAFLFLGCNDEAGFGTGFPPSSNPNPNPNPGAPAQKSCLAVFVLNAVFDEDPATEFVDESFYWVADSLSLTLVDSDCPFAIDPTADPFGLAVGQSIQADPVDDLFGLMFNQALVFGFPIVTDPQHLSFTLSIGPNPFVTVPACSYATVVDDGTLAPLAEGVGYELKATFPVVVTHASNVTTCEAALSTL